MNLASEVIIFREESAEPVMMTLVDPCSRTELYALLRASLGRPPDKLTIDGHGVAVATYLCAQEAVE